MLQRSPMYAYIPVADMSRARAFYEHKLGFVPTRADNGVVVYKFGDHTGCFMYPSANAAASLPKDWKAWPVPPHVQAIGDAWIQSGRSLALRVPRVIVTGGFNLLINPGHPKAGRLTIDAVEPYVFDRRLVR